MIATSTKVFVISDWKPYSKNTLQGFFTLTTPSGMVIRSCSLHQKGATRWVGMPAQKFVKDDGSASYVSMIEFVDRATSDRFRDGVLQALDQHLGGQR